MNHNIDILDKTIQNNIFIFQFYHIFYGKIK